MTGEVKYVTLTITDNQNGNKKTYQVEAGSRLKLTNSIHTIEKDCTIDVTLPQYQALQVFDHNNDKRIDTKDQEFFMNRHQKYLDSLGDESYDGLYLEDPELSHDISSRLGDSKYHIRSDGGGSFLGVDEYGFWVEFENQSWFERDENYDAKYINFQTPAQAKKDDDMTARQEKSQDELYAEKHPFLSKLGITREIYEKLTR